MMCLPALLLLLFFNYLPMPGILIAFKNYKFNLGIYGSEWVGFKNFQYLFASGAAARILTNTVFYNGLFIFTNLIISISLALLFNEVRSRSLARIFSLLRLLGYCRIFCGRAIQYRCRFAKQDT